MNDKYLNFWFLFALLYPGLLLAQEDYIKIQKFEETYKSTVVIPPDETYSEISEGYNHIITEGLLKWIQVDPNGFVLDVEIQETKMNRKVARTEEFPKEYEEDRKKWGNPYTARIYCQRGTPKELKVLIVKNEDPDPYLASQYVRVTNILDNLLLLTNSIDFRAKPKEGVIDCDIDYIDVVNWGERYTREISMYTNRPNGLSLVYECLGKTCTATLQSYHFDATGLLKYHYLYDPLTKKVSRMSWTQIQITDLNNLAELTPAELYLHLNDPDAPLRRIFYEIKLSE